MNNRFTSHPVRELSMRLTRILAILLYAAAFMAVPVLAQEVTYLDAPKVVPGSTVEMQSPEYWTSRIDGDPDRVIMTPAQIERFNERNRVKSYRFTDINGKEYSALSSRGFLVDDPLTILTFPGDSVRVMLEHDRKYLESRTFYDFRNRTWDEDMKNELLEAVDAGSVPDVITPRHGILVEHTHNRKFPTHLKAWPEQDSWLNSFGNTCLDAGMPVAILHETKDRDWYYVRSEIHFGWVPAVNVAVGSIAELDDYLSSPDFIVSCAYKVPVYSAEGQHGFIMDLYMGARLTMAGRDTGGYRVLVPFRKPDGSFSTVPGLVEPEAPVSVGYQPYTQRNLIDTFFTVLYKPWSSGDSYYYRHCCGTVRGVLRTFGIKVMNSTTLQLHASDHVISFPEDTPNDEKHRLLEDCEPGLTLIGSRAHVIMYLGKADGRYFVIHSTGYDYPENDTTVRMVRRVNVNDTMLPGGSQVDTWTYICTLKP